ASTHATDNKHHILLAASGSVATIKLPLIAAALAAHPTVSLRLLLTPSATHFLQSQSAEQPALESLAAIPRVDAIYQDADEWTVPWVRGNSILHIELRKWAHVMVVAPMSANTLAKMVHGVADNLLTSVIRAWDTTGLVDLYRKKLILVAPAMNTAMWEQPITGRQVGVLEGEWGVKVGGWVELLRPQEKTLSCGDTGNGAMYEWTGIVREVERRLGL
ncbi:putative flavo protein, partial [Eremomyces bilateralis CBS 781.70]